jgi:hypothetical protein
MVVRDVRPATGPAEEFRTGEIGLIWWSYGVEATGKKMGSAEQGVAFEPRQAANETNAIRRQGESDMKNISLEMFSIHRARLRA